MMFPEKKDLKFINLKNQSIVFNNIISFEFNRENNTIEIITYDKYCYTQHEIPIPIKHISNQLAQIFLNDIFENTYTDFIETSIYELFCRKYLIYLTIELCQTYGNAHRSNTFTYIDNCLDSLKTDCSNIFSSIDFYKKDSEWFFYGKYVEENQIKFYENEYNNKEDFEKLFYDWKILFDECLNFDVIDE